MRRYFHTEIAEQAMARTRKSEAISDGDTGTDAFTQPAAGNAVQVVVRAGETILAGEAARVNDSQLRKLMVLQVDHLSTAEVRFDRAIRWLPVPEEQLAGE